MLSIKFDTKGTKKIKWPGTDIAIIETARALITAEAELPDSDCFPKQNLLKRTLKEAEDALGLVALNENSSVLDENDAFDIAKDFARVIVAGLTYFHAHELPVLKEWGVDVIDGKSQTPIHKKDVTDLLEKYIKKEEKLQESEQLPTPPLEQVSVVTKALLAAQARREQKKERSKGRPEEVSRLLDLLQLAAAFHTVVNFEGIVDGRLVKLGFEIITVPEKKARKRKIEDGLPAGALAQVGEQKAEEGLPAEASA